MNALRKFFSLTHTERVLALKCYALVWIVRLSLWLIPFRLLQKALKWFTPKKTVSNNSDPQHAELIVRLVKSASNYVPRATCLTQALSARLLLLRAGYDAELRLGVMKDEHQNFQAHAWIESEGRVLIGDNNQLTKYTPLPAASSDML